MKTLLKHSWLIVIVLVLIASCKSGKDDPNAIKITNKNFGEEVSSTQNLTFTFNRDLAPDSLLHNWDTIPYITFTPKIPGRFRWANKNELVFSPQSRFSPSTEYKGTFGKELLANASDKKLKLPSTSSFSFHTPFLKIKSNSVYWKPSGVDKNEPVIGAKLLFNYDVAPTSIAENLKVKVNGSSTEFKVLNASNSKDVQLELVTGKLDLDEDREVSFVLASGMPILNSNASTRNVLSAERMLTSPAELDISTLDAEHDGIEGRIYVTTTQQVESEGLKSHISLKPAIAFTVEHNTNGFTIASEAFESTSTYELTISKNLPGVFKGKLGDDYSQQISFGKLEPSIAFVNESSMYLSNKGNKNMGVQMVNVPKVKVEISKIFQNNIMSFMRSGQEWGWHSYNDGDYWDYFDYKYYDISKYGKVVAEQEYNTSELDKMGSVRLLNIDFEDQLDQFKGIYVIKVTDADRHYITDSKVISYSDIGMIARQEDNKVYVFLNSISEAQAMGGIQVSFVSNTNQRLISTTTDADGVATFDNIEATAPGFSVAMITAQAGGDYNYMLLEKSNVTTSRFDVGGKHNNPANLEAFVYGDRNLYRPGETMHVSTIVRNSDWGTPSDIPIKLKLLLPNGKEYKSVRKTLNGEGATETAFDIPGAAVTGTYTIEAYTGNDVLLAAKPVSVEEFMPDRIKVDIRTDKEVLNEGESITLSGTATNLFGPPATNRNFEISMDLKRKLFAPKELSDYTFHTESNKNFGEVLKQGKTDENGNFIEQFDIPKEYADMGLLGGKFFATVFDESGRPVNRQANFEVYTQDVFYGIGNFGRYVSSRNPINIPLVAVDKEGAVQKDVTAHVKIIRYYWRTVLEEAGRGRYRYRSQKDEVIEVDKPIKLSGKNHFAFTPDHSGTFEVRVSRPGSDAYVTKKFYAYRWGDTQSTSFEVNREGRVDIEFDKDQYNVGETAKVLFKTPFEGRLLVTMERDKVIQHMYFNTDKKAAQINFEVTKDYVPNIFVTATLIRPMKELGVPLTVAHGFAPLMVDNPKNHLPLEIVANDASRSKTKQKITVKTTPNADVTLAVVDEGILQIKNYKTPDPYAFFYQKRALEVESYDLYPYLFPEMVGTGGFLTGGDEGFDLSKRVNPVQDKRVKLVSEWSGILKSDSRGRVEYEVDIPQFSGDLRVMAVAYKDNKFASSHTNMKVADPVVISAGLPRFLSPSDEINVPVTMSNTTKKGAEANVSIAVSGPLEVVGADNMSKDLAANSENRAAFKVRAKPEIGIGKITVTVDALGEKFVHETEMGVRPPSSLLKMSGSGAIAANAQQAILMDNNFIPESIDGQLVVSKSPLAEFGNDLEYLVGYPHGCLEQTVSKAFPQIYFADLTKNMNRRTAVGATSHNPNYNVQQAIKKIESMQVSNGSLTFWPGGGHVNWWGTVYAAHFLIEAEKAGFEVNTSMKSNLLKYLRSRLKKKETFVYYYYNDAGKELKKEIAQKEVPYSLYVLATAGKPDISTMNYYKANTELLSRDGLYLLAGAYALAGDVGKASQVLPENFDGERSKRVSGGSFYSPIRDKAIALNALIETNPDHPQVGVLTRHLQQDFRKQRYLSTQERAFTMLAFGKVAKAANQGNVQATLVSNGKTIGTFKGDDLVLSYGDINAKEVQVKTTGDGKLFYFWNMEGMSADGDYPEEDSFLKIRKTFYDRFGRVIENNQFEQNDLVVVKLSLLSTGSNNVENVVVSDILPAGFEIENPRISDIPDAEWIENAATPEHTDFRDDRVHIYTYATNQPKDFYYMVRAVSPGTFQMGPASADAMYDGEYHSYFGGGVVNVAEK